MNRIRRAAVLAVILSLVALNATVLQAQQDRHVKIINRSSAAILYLYASNVDDGEWHGDILGRSRVILPDHYLVANIDDGTGYCLFDIKATLADGREATTRNFNVCRNSTWTVTD